MLVVVLLCKVVLVLVINELRERFCRCVLCMPVLLMVEPLVVEENTPLLVCFCRFERAFSRIHLWISSDVLNSRDTLGVGTVNDKLHEIKQQQQGVGVEVGVGED